MGGKIALLCALEKIEGIVGLVLIAPDGLPSLKDRLKEIDIPVLLIWGDRGSGHSHHRFGGTPNGDEKNAYLDPQRRRSRWVL